MFFMLVNVEPSKYYKGKQENFKSKQNFSMNPVLNNFLHHFLYSFCPLKDKILTFYSAK